MSDTWQETAAANSQGSAQLERRLASIQGVAGAMFSLFVLAHLINIMLAPLGPETFDQVQRTLRGVYQQPLFEILFIFGPILAHLVASLWRWSLQRTGGRRGGRRSLRARVHTWAGVFLALVIFGHVLAVRGPSLFADVYPEFEGVAFSIWFLPWYFYPYYFLLALAGFYHASNGLVALARRRGRRVPPGMQTGATAVVAVLVATALLSFGGVLVEIPDPADNDFARLYASVLGLELEK